MMDRAQRVFQTEMAQLLQKKPELRATAELQESVANIQSVFKVLRVRTAEYLARFPQPDAWVAFDIAKLTDDFLNFFAAVEKNSKGRYRIVFNIAAQEPADYLVNLRIESVAGDTITMPPVLQDVFRDLIANARKYTPPGGMIVAGLADTGAEIRVVVEDNGRGIPPDEIQRVVQFGYRASNAREVRTKGGGFGLTKAYLAAQRHSGRMWIKSSLGSGTRVTLCIPHPRAPSGAATQ
jgi:signal transduction histidine kinase